MTHLFPATRQRWLLIILLLLLAFGLRLFQIEGHDIWGDEAWSITVANWPLPQIVTSDAETNPPLYHILLHLALPLFGQTPLGIRYLSVISGILIAALLYRLGQEIGGRRLALWSGLAAALSPMLVYHAQDARMYGAALVGVSASLLAFVMLVKRQEAGRAMPRSLWFAYGAASLAGVHSHYYAFAVLLAQAATVTLLAVNRRQWRSLWPWLKAWGGMALLFLPWLLVHASFLGDKASGRFDELTLETLLTISRRTLLAFGGGTTLYPAESGWGWAVVLLALLGLAGLAVWSRCRWTALLFGVTLGGGFLFAWAINPIMPFFWERYLLVTIPAFLLGAAAGLESLYRLWRPAVLAGLFLLIGAAAISLGNYYFDPAFVKGEYGRLMQDLRQRANPDDLILLNNPLQGSLYDYYGPAEMTAQIISRGRLLSDEDAAALMAELTAGYRRVWLVEMGNPAEYDPQRRAQGWLSRQGSQAFFQSYHGAALSFFILSAAAEIETPLAANLNDEMLLVGYTLEVAEVRAGDPLLLTLFWQTRRPLTADYTVFTHLVNDAGQIAAQMDSQPVGGTRPTSTWQIGETIADNYALLLPEDLPAGRYQLQVGAYLWPELRRLPLLDEAGQVVDDKILLQAVYIETGE